MTRGRIRALVFFGFLAVTPARAGETQRLIGGLDHLPLAVADLESAAANFVKLGFLIKPGRPHGNGISNQHVKFPNGEGIELITAAAPTDALARDYVDWLRDGDGPAFWSIYSADLAALTTHLSARRVEPINEGHVVSFAQSALPHRLFFADRLRSPTDGPEFWAHPNTATELKSVWLANGADEATLLAALGAVPSGQSRCSPFTTSATTLSIPGENDEVIVVEDLPRTPARSIIGATVTVASLARAQQFLTAHKVPYVAGCKSRSVWIAPSEANGLWLEMRE